jgi:uroporphyrinogen decarboxylase
VIGRPVRSSDDVERLRPLEREAGVTYVLDAVELLVRELDVPLIGFAGGPFTLATYLIEGGPSRTHSRTKALMYGSPEVWHALMRRLSDAVLAHLAAQVDAGAGAVQLFDSWAGALDPGDYAHYVLPWTRRILEGLADGGAPRIIFGLATGELLGLMATAGADVIGVDWRVALGDARRRIGPGHALQGNLEPAACLAPKEVMERKAADVLARAGGRGHVFNLGHGVLPETDPGALAHLVEFVHEWRRDG